MSDTTPTLYQWVGGIERLNTLTNRFYERVKLDATLAEIFEGMDEKHPAHVAAFLGEVFGGPASYTAQHGGHPEMIRKHLNRHLNHDQRKAWIALLLDTADEIGVPDDPEFRSALIGYLEWGTRLAVINSQPDAEVDENAPMPKWGWGEVKGPYIP